MTRDSDAMDVDPVPSPPVEKVSDSVPAPDAASDKMSTDETPADKTPAETPAETPADETPVDKGKDKATPPPWTRPAETKANGDATPSEPAASASTPSAESAEKPSEKTSQPAGASASAGPSAGPSSSKPSPGPSSAKNEDDDEAAALAELLKGVPEPDVKAVLNKERAPGAQIDAASLSVPQLFGLVDKALALKADGNKAFTAKPKPNLELARDAYIRALDCLPAVPKHLPLPSPDEDRIREVSDEEAEQIELDFLAGPARVRADNAIRDAQKALWGNLGAVYSKQPGKEKETVEACTRALTFDPTYEKALLRRATANERIGTWSSLVAAQNDCAVLMTLLPPDADALVGVRKALDVLPAKIGNAKKKETADVVGKMGTL